MEEPTLSGLTSIKVDKPLVDLAEKKVDLSIGFDELVFHTNDYDREAKVFFTRKVTDKELIATLKDVSFGISLDLDFTVDGPVAKVKSATDILDDGKIDLNLDIPKFLEIFVPIVKGLVKDKVVDLIDEPLSTLITEKLQELYSDEKEIVDMLSELYKMKKAQGPEKDENGNPLKPDVLKGFDGVGQVAFPTFWKIPAIKVDELEHLTIDEVVANAKTGDLIMYAGVADGSYKIRQYTQSPFSHVSMIVKEPGFCEGKPVQIQAANAFHYNVLDDADANGIQVNDIVMNHADYKRNWYDGKEDKVVVAYRSFSMERSEEEQKKYSENLIKFIKERNGIPYAEGTDMNTLFLMGIIGIDLGEDSGTDEDKTYYCASFIADACMAYGMITDDFKHQQYSPRDFAEMYNTLPYMSPAYSHGPECVIDFE